MQLSMAVSLGPASRSYYTVQNQLRRGTLGARPVPSVRGQPSFLARSKRQGYGDYIEDDEMGYFDIGAYSNMLDTSAWKQPVYTPSRRPAGMRSVADDFDDLYNVNDEWYEEDDFPEPDPEPVPRYVNGKQLFINKEINAKSVRLIGGIDGREMYGIKPFSDALGLARDLGVDLILLNGETNPPLCRLVDWSKYKFEVEKTNKQKAAKSSNVETKEVRLRPKTDSNDLSTKLKSALKFLAKGNKVKVLMKFEGRELQFKDQGKEMLLRFIDEVGEAGKVDGPVNFKSSTYTVTIAPTGKAPGSSNSKDSGNDSSSSTSSQAVSANLPLPPLPPTPPQQAQQQQQQGPVPPSPRSVQGAPMRPPPAQTQPQPPPRPPLTGPVRPNAPPPINRPGMPPPLAPPGQPMRIPQTNRPGMPPPLPPLGPPPGKW